MSEIGPDISQADESINITPSTKKKPAFSPENRFSKSGMLRGALALATFFNTTAAAIHEQNPPDTPKSSLPPITESAAAQEARSFDPDEKINQIIASKQPSDEEKKEIMARLKKVNDRFDQKSPSTQEQHPQPSLFRLAGRIIRTYLQRNDLRDKIDPNSGKTLEEMRIEGQANRENQATVKVGHLANRPNTK